MTVFSKPGTENTEAALRIALQAASEMDMPIVLASNTGATAETLLRLQKETGLSASIVMVGQVYGFSKPGTAALSDVTCAKLEADGVRIVVAAHALSGAERSISRKFGGVYPAELVANALRMFSQGVKVCVEVGMMAMDCGALAYGKPVVAVGGSGRGADTVCIMTPSYTADFLSTRIHEILCKPGLYE